MSWAGKYDLVFTRPPAPGPTPGRRSPTGPAPAAGRPTGDYFKQPEPDPAQFGMPADDDGSRDDPLLSARSWAVSSYRPDVGALTAAPTRVVIAVADESGDTFTGRTSRAAAALLGQQAAVFPSHHGGFIGGESGYAGQPEAFAHTLRSVLGG